MKVIHLSASDYNGGAAIAAKRIVQSQQLITELDSKLLVQAKKSHEDFIFSLHKTLSKKVIGGFRKFADELSLRLLSDQSRGRFTFPFWGEDVSKNLLIKNSDLINLHWINGGFLSLKSLEKLAELNKPIVWTLHDMWGFTGGCHYASDCSKFKTQCSNCPSLIFKSENDLSNKIFEKKKKILDKLNLSVVTCSNWLANEVSVSGLLSKNQTVVIPNPLDVNLYIPFDKTEARNKLNLPVNKKLLLIGAMNLKDERKGFKYLIDALDQILKDNFIPKNDLEIVVFGKLDEASVEKLQFKVHQLGKLKNQEEIIFAYNSADIYVAPSLQDNLPNTVMESMACGVPVVAFNVGGIPDMVDDGINGILVELKSSEGLAKAIEKILSDEELRKNFSKAARQKVVKNFDQKIVAAKFYDLYKSIL